MKNEDVNSSSAPPRKPRFMPKIPARKQQPKPTVPKSEPAETKLDVDKELLAKLNNAMSQDGYGRRNPKWDTKAAPVQVAFGQGGTSMARTFGYRGGKLTGSKYEDEAPTEYVEPWAYEHTYYPVTLPLRRPYSGDPEILDEKEFGESSTNQALDESAINPARELGLMEPSNEPQMLFFQFPAALPLEKGDPVAATGKESADKPSALPASNVDGRQIGGRPGNKSKECCNLKDLPAGYMGKLYVYKSGKVKMKLGDALFDVSPGVSGLFAQDVAVMNVAEKHCCVLGDLNKRAVVTPDVDSLLDSIDSMGA